MNGTEFRLCPPDNSCLKAPILPLLNNDDGGYGTFDQGGGGGYYDDGMGGGGGYDGGGYGKGGGKGW